MSLGRFVTLLIVGFLGLCIWGMWHHGVANRDFEHLLTGSTEVALESLEIESNSGQMIPVTGFASLDYLSEMFRSAQIVRGRGVSDVPYDGSEYGACYHVNVRVRRGTIIRTYLRVHKNKDRITLLFPINEFGDGITYLVILSKPIPESVVKILVPLR